MSYTIYRADGTPITIPEQVISTQYYAPSANGVGRGVGIQLLGRNVINYGAAIAQDLVQLTENFARTTPPPDTTALRGQLWFNTGDNTLYVRVNDSTQGGTQNWAPVGSKSAGIGQPIHSPSGDLIGYSAAAVPSSDEIANYEPLNIAGNRGFLGWARRTPGDGMTTALTAPDNTVIGYIYPA